ncbi:MAG: hypothetical protein K9L85_02555 [Candidatus Peribacteraceae bacterium]|nr:hypothetical protein [Candidatus Peribacteraceae bacterium]
MDFLDFANFLRRRWLIVSAITLATVLAAVTVYFLQAPTEKLTLLFSVGVNSESEVEKGFDFTKAADDFADTISGWFRSPTLAERVSGVSGTPVSLAGSAQTTQNFLVEATFLADAGELVPAAIKQVLGEELAKYNLESKFKFFTTLHGESTSDARGSLPKIIAAAAFGGIVLAIAWLVLAANFGGRVNSVREAERILRTRASVIFYNPKKADANFLKKLAKKSGNSVLIGADFDTKKLGLELKNCQLPRDAEKLSKNDAKIVVVRLDESRVNTLRMIRALADEKIALAVWA